VATRDQADEPIPFRHMHRAAEKPGIDICPVLSSSDLCLAALLLSDLSPPAFSVTELLLELVEVRFNERLTSQDHPISEVANAAP